MDDLRTRIAKTLHRLYGPSLGAHPDGWDREPRATQETYLDDADAVIGELRQEWRADFGYDGYYDYDIREVAARDVADYNSTNEPDGGWQDGEQAVLMRRYVTEWIADD